MNNTGTQKKWSVSGITLPYPCVFWLVEQESEFRKSPLPSSFEQIQFHKRKQKLKKFVDYEKSRISCKMKKKENLLNFHYLPSC